MTAREVVVVGTGTDVGKTHVAAALVRWLASQGLSVAGLKPIESGVDGTGVTDAEVLQTASNVRAGSAPPYRLVQPVSPHLAARTEGATIDVARAVAWCRSVEAEVRVVESAGGLLSPLSRDATNLDLVRGFPGASILVVTTSRLGVLHDLAALRIVLGPEDWRRSVVALADSRIPDASSATNGDEIAWLGLSEHVVRWPFAAPASAETAHAAAATWLVMERLHVSRETDQRVSASRFT